MSIAHDAGPVLRPRHATAPKPLPCELSGNLGINHPKATKIQQDCDDFTCTTTMDAKE